MKAPAAHRKLSFHSKLENIAPGMRYFAVSVPLKITRALGTRMAVPVFARVNGSEKFLASLYPVGAGRHYLRIKYKICDSVNIKKGDRVEVRLEIRDRQAEIAIPNDLRKALRAEGVLEEFNSFPPGKKSFILRRIDQAAKQVTREKRIQDAVDEALRKN